MEKYMLCILCLLISVLTYGQQIGTNMFSEPRGKILEFKEQKIAQALLSNPELLNLKPSSKAGISSGKASEAPLRFLSAIHDDEVLAGLHDVQLQGDYAYVTGKGPWGNIVEGKGSFAIINISDPKHPFVEGSITDGLTNGETVLLDGDICYIGSHHFWSVDVSDPGNPKVLAKLEDPRIQSINGMTRLGDYLYAASKKNHITVFDIRDPKNPKLVRSVEPKGDVFNSPHDIDRLDDRRIVVVNIHAHRGYDRLRVYRVASDDSGAPLPEDEWVLEGSLNDERFRGANRVRVRDEYALVVCNKGFSVGVIDLRNPNKPEITSWFPTDDRPRYKSCGMDVAGDVMIAVGWGVIGLFDIFELPVMTKIGEYQFEEPVPDHNIIYRQEQLNVRIQSLITPDHDIEYRDGFIYTTDQNENTFAIYEVTDPGLRKMMDRKE